MSASSASNRAKYDYSRINLDGNPFRSVKQKPAPQTSGRSSSSILPDLFVAAQEGNVIRVSELISASKTKPKKEKKKLFARKEVATPGFDINATGWYLLPSGKKIRKVTPLFIACRNGHEKIVEALCNNGAAIDAGTPNNITPLIVSCQYGHASIVRFLVDNKADIEAVTRAGTCALSMACENGHKDIVEFLIQKGARIDVLRKNGMSALFAADGGGFDEIVRMLLKQGADPNTSVPLIAAASGGHIDTIRILAQADARIDATAPLEILADSVTATSAGSSNASSSSRLVRPPLRFTQPRGT